MAAAARRRLLRDCQEIEAQPLETVAARPRDGDLFEWHANLRPSQGPLAGITFHLVLRFPRDYPCSPPKLSFPASAIPSFRHPNVFSDSGICLDMLSASGGGRYGGWSSAYSVQSILLQLQSFLLEDRIPQDGGGTYRLPRSESTIRQIGSQAAAYCCRGCRHRGSEPWPPLMAADEAPASPVGPRAQAVHSSSQVSLSSDLWVHVLEMLLPPDLLRARKVQTSWEGVVRDCALLARHEMVCFHTKQRACEAVLGVGVTAKYHRAHAPFACPASGAVTYHDSISEVHVELDLLSSEAFTEQGVRCGVWKEDFEDFVPLALNPAHAQRARPLLEDVTRRLAKAGLFEPWHYLIINSFVVELLHDQVMGDRASRANSERAVDGYCAFHHLLLRCAERHPELRVLAARRVRAFLESETERSKAGTPDLGQFLVLCTLVRDSRWADLWKPYLQESLTRNVRRLFQHQEQRAKVLADHSTQSHYELLEASEGWLSYEQEADLTRLRRKFDAAVATGAAGDPHTYAELRGLGDEDLQRYWFGSTKTGKRLLMYQVAFMRTFGRPARQEANLAEYDRRWGLPTDAQRREMFRLCRQALAVDSWEGFFEALSMQTPPGLANILRKALNVSAARGYHRVRYAPAFYKAEAEKLAATSAMYRRPAGGLWEVFSREAQALRARDPAPFATRPAAAELSGKAGAKGGFKTQMCRYFEKGYCSRGSACTYAHGQRELHAAKVAGKGSGLSVGKRR